MAYVKMTAIKSSRAGVVLPQEAAVTQQSFENTGKELLVINNGGATELTVTINVSKSVDGLVVPDKTVAIAAGATEVIGPFPEALYNDADNLVNIDLSAVTSVKIGVLVPGALDY